jgi:hypothetical protein
MTCPPSVRAAACRVFGMASVGGMLAATVHDSRLDEPEIDTLAVTIVAASPLLRIELHLVLNEGTCVILGRHEPAWPTSVRVRSPETTIEVPLADSGRMLLDPLDRGPKQFVYCSEQEPTRLVRTEWLHL